MATYIVTAYRSTDYRVEADSREAAIELMLEGEGDEIHGETHEIRAELEFDGPTGMEEG